MRIFILAAFILVTAFPAAAQSTRLRDDNRIGWYAATATLPFAKGWSGHLEYQWRRIDFVRTHQQHLVRVGINRAVAPGVTLHAGYAWISTPPYGDYPINGLGKTFPEHRVYEQAVLGNTVGRVDFVHRFRLEQRWIGRYNSTASDRPDGFTYLNRARYMGRVQVPLQGKTLDNGEFYTAAYDELFVQAGKGVGENVFDQNRAAVLLGYRFGKGLRVEAGPFQQIAQLGREIDGRNVFQYNNGFILNVLINAPLRAGIPD